MKEIRYFQFPLMLIRDMESKQKEVMNRIINYSLVDFALKMDIDPEDAARQLVYDTANKSGLEEATGRLIQRHDDFTDPEYVKEAFFSRSRSGEFWQEPLPQMQELFNADPELKELAVLNAQLNKIKGFMGITGLDPNTGLALYLETCRLVGEHEKEHGPDPRPTVDLNLFFDLIKDDPTLVCMYVAIRSIEGQRQFAATNRPTICGRMAGAKSPKVLSSHAGMLKSLELYNKRYTFDKTLQQLIGRGLVKSTLRKKNWSKFFVSTKLDPESLGEAVANQKMKRNAKKINDVAATRFQQVYNATGL